MRNKSNLAVVLLVHCSFVGIFGVTLNGCRKKGEAPDPALEAAESLIESLDEIEKTLPENETIEGIERVLSKPSKSNE